MQWGKKKRFILKCEYLFSDWLSMAIKFFILYLISLLSPFWFYCFVSMMQDKCFHCIWMLNCTIFMCCSVDFCNGLGVSWQAVWSLKINLNCKSHKVSIALIDFSFPLITHNVSDWFNLTNYQRHHRIDLSGWSCMEAHKYLSRISWEHVHSQQR